MKISRDLISKLISTLNPAQNINCIITCAEYLALKYVQQEGNFRQPKLSHQCNIRNVYAKTRKIIFECYRK